MYMIMYKHNCLVVLEDGHQQCPQIVSLLAEQTGNTFSSQVIRYQQFDDRTI